MNAGPKNTTRRWEIVARLLPKIIWSAWESLKIAFAPSAMVKRVRLPRAITKMRGGRTAELNLLLYRNSKTTKFFRKGEAASTGEPRHFCFERTHMKTIRFSVLFLILSGFVFAGTKEDMEQLQRNVIELQQQFWNLENDLKTNNASFT